MKEARGSVMHFQGEGGKDGGREGEGGRGREREGERERQRQRRRQRQRDASSWLC